MTPTKETWDERYAGGKFSSSEPHKLLIDIIRKLPPGRALDLACGTGRHAIFLAQNGWNVTAVDNSAVGVEIARARAAETGLKIDFRVADLEKGEFEIGSGAYDLICDFYYLQRDLSPAMKAGVRPGGMVISTVHIYGEGEETEGFLLKEGELRTFFEDLDILHYHETSLTDTDAGDHHRRTAEIIAKRIS
jgi:SAM-dependent methyltransferase